MKTYRTPLVRWIGSVLTTTTLTALAATGWFWFMKVMAFLNRLEPPVRRTRLEEQILGAGGLAVILGVGILFLLAGLSLLRTRCEVGARAIVLHRGLLWRSTHTIPLLSLTTIEVSSGPLMRLFGLGDLTLAGSKLYGIPKAEELRSFLLDRRDALQEAARSGELDVAQGTAELVQERLARAIERLEGRLPRG